MTPRLLLVLVLLALPSPLEAQLPLVLLPRLLALLERSPGFLSIVKLLTRFRHAIKEFVERSTDGITIFAPTDNAFHKLPFGYLDSLTLSEKRRLLQLHIVPFYARFDMLLNGTCSVRTLTSRFILNVTNSNGEVRVSAGLTTARAAPVYSIYPLVIFSVDSVLIPPALAAASSPWSAPAEGPAVDLAPDESPAEPPSVWLAPAASSKARSDYSPAPEASSPGPSSGSSEGNRVGDILVAAGLAWLGLLV